MTLEMVQSRRIEVETLLTSHSGVSLSWVSKLGSSDGSSGHMLHCGGSCQKDDALRSLLWPPVAFRMTSRPCRRPVAVAPY